MDDVKAEDEAAIAVFVGVLVIVGGLKAMLWPWILRRRGWTRRSSDSR
jgi:hypothetical protein